MWFSDQAHGRPPLTSAMVRLCPLMESQCPRGRGTHCSQPRVPWLGYSALFKCKRPRYSKRFGTYCFVPVHDHGVLPGFTQPVGSGAKQTPRLPLSILSPPQEALFGCLLKPLTFWFPVWVSQWEAHHETERRQESGLGYLSPCLASYKVIFGVFSP